MIREIIHDKALLAMKSEPATEADKQIITDLAETLKAHKERCVGMAANMIGSWKNIIVVYDKKNQLALINPVITQKSKPYLTEESCLSIAGVKKTMRYDVIEVEYQDTDFKPKKGTFRGFTAQIIQHEIDHCNGILI